MKAALFDLDGTLVDNMKFHFAAWKQIATRLGVQLDDMRVQREFAGKRNEEILPLLGVALADIPRLAAEKEALYRELYRPHVTFVRGAQAYIAQLRARHIKTAIASAAPMDNRNMVLDALGARPLFDAVAGGEEVRHGKPAPDLFELAATRLGVPPSECLVFEDAVLGVRGAVAAGCRVIGVTTVESAEALRAAGAEQTIQDFEGQIG